MSNGAIWTPPTISGRLSTLASCWRVSQPDELRRTISPFNLRRFDDIHWSISSMYSKSWVEDYTMQSRFNKNNCHLICSVSWLMICCCSSLTCAALPSTVDFFRKPRSLLLWHRRSKSNPWILMNLRIIGQSRTSQGDWEVDLQADQWSSEDMRIDASFAVGIQIWSLNWKLPSEGDVRHPWCCWLRRSFTRWTSGFQCSIRYCWPWHPSSSSAIIFWHRRGYSPLDKVVPYRQNTSGGVLRWKIVCLSSELCYCGVPQGSVLGSLLFISLHSRCH